MTEKASYSYRQFVNDRRYLPLFFTQFFGAFNDNAFKLAMLTLISFYLNQSETDSQFYQALAGGLFTIPFFLLSASSGQLADKFNKAILSRWIKGFECILMAFGGIALYLGNIYFMMLILFGLGIHSTFFGPIKYAILPELLSRKRLLAGTALIEASTFIAILFGTSLGALTVGKHSVLGAIFLTNLIAWLGLFSSFFIPTDIRQQNELTIDWNFFRATYRMTLQVMSQAEIVTIILAISWFWFVGAVIMIKLPDYVRYVLDADNQVFALFLVLFSIGIALGSLSINRFLKGKITIRWVPLALFGISLFAFDLYYLTSAVSNVPSEKLPLLTLKQFLLVPQNWRIIVDFFALCICGGMYIVPCYTALQTKSDISCRSRTIAVNNIINSAFMVLASVFVMFLLQINFNIQSVFLILAIINVLVCFGLWLIRAKRIIRS